MARRLPCITPQLQNVLTHRACILGQHLGERFSHPHLHVLPKRSLMGTGMGTGTQTQLCADPQQLTSSWGWIQTVLWGWRPLFPEPGLLPGVPREGAGPGAARCRATSPEPRPPASSWCQQVSDWGDGLTPSTAPSSWRRPYNNTAAGRARTPLPSPSPPTANTRSQGRDGAAPAAGGAG